MRSTIYLNLLVLVVALAAPLRDPVRRADQPTPYNSTLIQLQSDRTGDQDESQVIAWEEDDLHLTSRQQQSRDLSTTLASVSHLSPRAKKVKVPSRKKTKAKGPSRAKKPKGSTARPRPQKQKPGVSNLKTQWDKPKSLLPVIKKFDMATHLRYAGKSRETTSISKASMDRAKLPQGLKFRTGTFTFKYRGKKGYFQTRSAAVYKKLQTLVSGGKAIKHQAAEGIINGEEHMASLIHNPLTGPMNELLRIAMRIREPAPWKGQGGGTSPISDLRLQVGKYSAVVELKTQMVFNETHMDTIVNEASKFTLLDIVDSKTRVAFPSLTFDGQEPKDRDGRERVAIMMEQVSNSKS